MSRKLKRLLLGSAALIVVAGASALAWDEVALRSARAALDRHDPHAARSRLARCIGPARRQAEFELLAGSAARMLEEFDAAEQHLTECQRREGQPTEESTLEWAMLQAQRGEMEPVETFLRKQVDSHHARSTLILQAMAAGYLRLYALFDALNCIRQWLEREPGQPRALELRGRAYQRVHAYGRAVDDFRSVLEQEPDNDDVRFLLANALIENSQAPDAIAHLERLRQARPDDVEVQVRLAFAWNMAGRIDESRALLDAVLAANPRYGPALSARGQLELQLRDPASAESLLRKALEQTPYDRQTHYALLQALLQQVKTHEAAEQEVRLKRIEATINRMIEVTNRLLPQHRTDPKLNHELGALLAEMGYEEKAEYWFLQALQHDPDFGPAHRSLAEYYEKKGDAQRAAAHRAKIAPAPR